jgi:putative DNA primase/helicase
MKQSLLPPAVRRVADFEYSVFPQLDDPNGRKGFVKWGKYRTTTPSRTQLYRWRKKWPDAMWAVITGKNGRDHGLVVLDFDGAEGVATAKRLGLKPHVKTTSGGWHVWVESPDSPLKSLTHVGGERYPGLDAVKAEGGCSTFYGRRNGRRYVTRLAKCKVYQWDALPAEFRQFVEAKCKFPELSEIADVPDDFVSDLEPGALLKVAVDRVNNGDARNDTGFWLACQLRDERHTQDEALRALELYADAVTALGDHPYAYHEAYNSVISAFSEPPRTPRRLRPITGAGPTVDVTNEATAADWLREEVLTSVEISDGGVGVVSDVLGRLRPRSGFGAGP